MDFVADRLANGKAFRILTLVLPQVCGWDNVSRVSPAIGADFKMSGKHLHILVKQVTEVLDRAVVIYGLPKAIQVDNGSEFAGKELDAWAYRNKVKLCFSRPGKPTLSHTCDTDNAYIESFNGSHRHVTEQIPKRVPEYALVRLLGRSTKGHRAMEKGVQYRKTIGHIPVTPHSSLGMKTPAQFAAEWQTPEAKEEGGN